jgi:hypothetical protein
MTVAVEYRAEIAGTVVRGVEALPWATAKPAAASAPTTMRAMTPVKTGWDVTRPRRAAVGAPLSGSPQEIQKPSVSSAAVPHFGQ